MALTLDPTLAAAQDSQSRHPILELITSKGTPDIPFLGNRLTGSSSDESKPNVIIHSTGRIEQIHRVSGHLYLAYTDTGRMTFTYVDLPLGAYNTPVEATLCELSNGNIGIVFITATQLVSMVVSPTGEVVSAAAQIATFTSGTVTSPWVIRLAAGGHLLVYAFNDSGNYEINKRTSADFLSWSSATDITPSGLLGTNWKTRTSLLQITTGQIWLWFDYLTGISGDDELVNVYYSTSDDGGGTWSAATKFTNMTLYGTGAKHPVALQNLVNTMLLMYYEQINAIHLNDGNAGFCSIDEGNGSRIHAAWPTDLTLDTVNRKLYILCTVTAGVSYLLSLFRVDLDTLTIDACWNDESVPAINAMLCDQTQGIGVHRNQGDGHLVPIGSGLVIDLLDGEADTITSFIFTNYPEHSLVQNVTWTPIHEDALGGIHSTWVDHSASRLYVLIVSTDYWHPGILLGYFDLTESGGHTFVEVVRDTSWNQAEMLGLNVSWANLEIYPSEDLALISSGGDSYQGWTALYNLSAGGLYKKYSYALTPGYPYWGVREARYKGGEIYGGFTYTSNYEEGDKRGLCRIDTATDLVSFFRPPWATADDYGIISQAFTDDNRLVINCWNFGVGIFDLTTQAWDPTLYNNDSVPGMVAGINPYTFIPVVYDPATNMIYVGQAGYTSGFKGLIGFSDSGALMQTKYQEGTFTTFWSWSAVETLIQGIHDYDAVGAYGANSLYAFWTRENPDDGTTRIMWDHEGNTLNLQDYISKNQEIAIDWNIDGPPNRLSFAITHGHLFDPHNAASLLSSLLRKGRKITCRMGDKVSGVNYWQEQGTFYVNEFALSHERRRYPEAKIVAEDKRRFWDHKQVLVSEYYQTYPEPVLTDVLTDLLGMQLADIELPTFDNRAVIYAQWIETMAKEIIDEICQRFGYFPKMTVEGKFSVGKISDTNGVSHTYPDSSRLINFTPDDKYSNFTNKVIVTGTERNFIEVIFDEERVGQLSGTIGWWGCKQTHDVYYSYDHSRRCRAPRLKVLESASSVGFQMAGQIHESISYVDTYETYCTITITAPNLLPLAIGFIAVIIANYWVGDAVTKAWTRPVGTLIQMVAIVGLNMVLAAVGNFQYEVWARPIGTQRRSIQSTDDHGNDLEHQVEMGEEILNVSEEPLAVTVAELNTVADQKILVEKLQRRRVALSKTAHLQDEIGDTIRHPHPQSGQNMDFFITRLRRAMKISSKGKRDGYFRDSIEGWRL